jgi:hypothetical protein
MFIVKFLIMLTVVYTIHARSIRERHSFVKDDDDVGSEEDNNQIDNEKSKEKLAGSGITSQNSLFHFSPFSPLPNYSVQPYSYQQSHIHTPISRYGGNIHYYPWLNNGPFMNFNPYQTYPQSSGFNNQYYHGK